MFDKQQANSIFWSPQGQFMVLAGLRRSVLCVCVCMWQTPKATDDKLNNFSDTSYESSAPDSNSDLRHTVLMCVCVCIDERHTHVFINLSLFVQYERSSCLCGHVRLHNDEHCRALHGLWCGMGPDRTLCRHLRLLVEPQGTCWLTGLFFHDQFHVELPLLTSSSPPVCV